MNYLALLIGSYLAIASQQPNITNELSEWEAFKLEHGKTYENEQIESLRRAIFFHNKQRIDQFYQTPESQYFSVKLNRFADLSSIEMKSRKGFKLPEAMEARRAALRNLPEAEKFLNEILNDNLTEVPDELDWRQVPGRVSRVKDQANCGSCWAFASTGALEGQESVRKHVSSIIELSEQNLVDCVKKASGCGGGWMKDAFESVRTEGGIDTEQSYPYEAETNKCRFNPKNVAFNDSGAAILPTADEQKLKEVVAKFGPVSVAIDADNPFFLFYSGGIYYSNGCKTEAISLDHAVLVVGYGTDPKKGDYWIVKNSWGSDWGEHGYIRMARNYGNMCGIATVATIPTF